MRCTLYNSDSPLLSLHCQEFQGAPWTLKASFLWAFPEDPPSPLALDLIAGKGRRAGWAHSWTLRPYDAHRRLLEIEGGPFPLAWLVEREKAVHALQGDLETLMARLCSPLDPPIWSVAPKAQTAEQWLQLDESRWDFMHRVCHDAGYWWEHPYGEGMFKMACSQAPEGEAQGLRWDGPPPARTREGDLLLTTSREGLHVGSLVRMSGNAPAELFYVMEAEHSFAQNGAVLGHGPDTPYQVALRLRPSHLYAPPQPPPEPVRSLWQARIASPRDEWDKNPVQEDGRYPVYMAFEEPSTRGWGRLARLQPLGGRYAAMHLPLQAGTPVWLGFLPGQPDQPCIVGALEEARIPAVGASNRDDYVLRTRQGAVLRATDMPEEQSAWEMRTAKDCFLSLSDDTRSAECQCGELRLSMQAKEGRALLETGSGLSLSLDARTGEAKLELDDGPILKLCSQGSCAELSVPGCATLKIEQGKGMTLQSESSLTLKAQEIKLEASTSLSLQGADTSMELNQTGLKIQTSGDMHCDTGGGMELKASEASFQSESSMHLHSVNVKISADSVLSQKATLIQLN